MRLTKGMHHQAAFNALPSVKSTIVALVLTKGMHHQAAFNALPSVKSTIVALLLWMRLLGPV
ncbi:unnamed protein product [Oppiella nova]|uniref:Uncharacterized protein n=1 Tax=Oppiella nova TaxID=334625 RepID=A0A7R9QIK2_9ACAR|nr:unnamed protein product [Oppiella nova]CAG2166067.1 unnamed protein product [Oppiella nova]